MSERLEHYQHGGRWYTRATQKARNEYIKDKTSRGLYRELVILTEGKRGYTWQGKAKTEANSDG